MPPPPPVGEPSDGSGAYIPTFVQDAEDITNQYLGNRECEKQGVIRDHFYYDESLLDLSWSPAP